MNDLIKMTVLVKSILESDEQARNSDNYLYLKVIEHKARHSGIDLDGLTVRAFWQSMDAFGFPGFETVRRTRQKIQAAHPELAANDCVSQFRAENEDAYRAYARSEAV